MTIRFLSLLLPLILSFSLYSHAAPASPPNILLILTDDQGFWETRNAGNPNIDTPTLDRLAADGVSFSRFYACPVCSPTRAGLMTGRSYLRTGLYNTRFGGDTMAASEITLPQLLKSAGYRTGLFGKWHLGRYAGYQPHQRGFDEFLGHLEGHIERYDYPDQLLHNGHPIQARGYITDLLTDAAIDFVRTSNNKPFFCYLAYNAPHSPFNASDSHDGQPRGDAVISKYLARGLPLRDARIYALVDLIDQNLARLLDELDKRNLRENTIVLFSSDNGGVSTAFNAGLRGRKASVFEGGVRVPFYARYPGHFPAGAKLDAMASHLDVLPTLCDLLKIPLPADRPLDGRSLLPLLTRGAGSSPHEFLCHTWDRYFPNPDKNWAICSRQYKLVGTQLKKQGKFVPTLQLFDLLADPGESTNIAAKHPEIVQSHRAQFLRWFHDVTAGQTYTPIPIPVGHPDENPVEIQASWAKLANDNVAYVFRGYDWDTLEAWRKPGDSASWDLDIKTPGRYEITLSYGLSPTTPGGTLRLSIANTSLTHTPQPTPTADVFVTARIGTLSLPPGRTTLRAEPATPSNHELMRLNRLWLRKLD